MELDFLREILPKHLIPYTNINMYKPTFIERDFKNIYPLNLGTYLFHRKKSKLK